MTRLTCTEYKYTAGKPLCQGSTGSIQRMVSYHVTSLPVPAFGLERANEVIIRALRFTPHHGADIARMTPETPNVSIVGGYNLLSHLVGVFYAIVARPVLGPYSLETRAGCQVTRVARATDAVPRFAHPVLHCFVYPYAT